MKYYGGGVSPNEITFNITKQMWECASHQPKILKASYSLDELLNRLHIARYRDNHIPYIPFKGE